MPRRRQGGGRAGSRPPFGGSFRPVTPSSRAPAPCPRPPRSPYSAPCSCSMAARSSRSAMRSNDHHRGDAFSPCNEGAVDLSSPTA